MNAKELQIIAGWFAEWKEVQAYNIQLDRWEKMEFRDLKEKLGDPFGHFRLEPAPVKRLIRVEELPPVCWVSWSGMGRFLVVEQDIPSNSIFFHERLMPIVDLVKGATKWTDDPRKPFDQWNSFEVEDK